MAGSSGWRFVVSASSSRAPREHHPAWTIAPVRTSLPIETDIQGGGLHPRRPAATARSSDLLETSVFAETKQPPAGHDRDHQEGCPQPSPAARMEDRGRPKRCPGDRHLQRPGQPQKPSVPPSFPGDEPIRTGSNTGSFRRVPVRTARRTRHLWSAVSDSSQASRRRGSRPSKTCGWTGPQADLTACDHGNGCLTDIGSNRSA